MFITKILWHQLLEDSGCLYTGPAVTTHYALFNIDGNQVSQELVSRDGKTFGTILEETNKVRDEVTEDMSI
uniref:Uncharacterized protein n=1 Tax=Helianthus annuus TaxID=4232 RepID=A0A251RL25_HELAN